MPFGFGHSDPNTPHTGLDNPWIGRGLTMINPLLGIGYRLWRGIHNRHLQQPIYGSPGFGFQPGNPYGGFGGGYGLTGSGYGSTGAGSYGSGQGFGNGLGALSRGVDQFGLPTGPVNTATPGQAPANNGLGQLGQSPVNPHFGEYDRQMAENAWENNGFSLNTRSGADALMRRYQQ